jgi:hypothetical protein
MRVSAHTLFLGNTNPGVDWEASVIPTVLASTWMPIIPHAGVKNGALVVVLTHLIFNHRHRIWANKCQSHNCQYGCCSVDACSVHMFDV